MSRYWYAQTASWASVAKEKRAKRKSRRAAHGPYAARGRSSETRKGVRAVLAQVEREETAAVLAAMQFTSPDGHPPDMPGIPRANTREPNSLPEKPEKPTQ